MSLSALGLSYGFASRVLGCELDFELHPNEVVCVLGPNGSGKSTLFRTLLGLQAPLAGEVRLDRVALHNLTRARIAQRVAYVPQASNNPLDLSVQEMVELGRASHLGIFTRPTRHDRAQAMRAIDRVGLADLAHESFTRLSWGERQLVLIARALSSEAPFLILDEPTASLDFGNQARILSELAQLAAHGHGVLFCTHDPDHAFLIAQRVLLLRRGGPLAQGATADVLTSTNLRAVYDIEVGVDVVKEGEKMRRVCIPSLAGSRAAVASGG